MQDFYVRYSVDTFIADMLSGSPITETIDGHVICRAHYQDGEDFIEQRKVLHHYSVKEVDGYAEFQLLSMYAPTKRFLPFSNSVCDLSYRTNFINQLDIKYHSIDHTDNKKEITLAFDIKSIEKYYRDNFYNLVTPERNRCYIYVTGYQSPQELIEKFVIDLLDLSVTGTITLQVNTNRAVSVWGARI